MPPELVALSQVDAQKTIKTVTYYNWLYIANNSQKT